MPLVSSDTSKISMLFQLKKQQFNCSNEQRTPSLPISDPSLNTSTATVRSKPISNKSPTTTLITNWWQTSSWVFPTPTWDSERCGTTIASTIQARPLTFTPSPSNSKQKKNRRRLPKRLGQITTTITRATLRTKAARTPPAATRSVLTQDVLIQKATWRRIAGPLIQKRCHKQSRIAEIPDETEDRPHPRPRPSTRRPAMRTAEDEL
ncbi:hypothetical protein V8C35DRAFT_291428 [Trichoderma chlorosporum]